MIKKLLSNLIILIVEICILMAAAYFTNLGDYFGLSLKGIFTLVVCLSLALLLLVKWLLYVFGERRYLNSPIGKIDKMSGEEFEDYLRHKFTKRGYKVEMTPASNDYGADLICTDKNGVLVVQAKRYEAHVGTAAVQEVTAARDFYEADRCMVVTNNYFTKNAIELADANGVELIDRDELLRL